MTSQTASPKPWATLSLDLDDLWSYQRSFGVADWQNYPTFLDRALPRILDILEGLGLKLTVFVIGRDAEMPRNKDLLVEVVRRGHEIGNHSYDHALDLHRWPRERISDEIGRAEVAIAEATGQTPRGFRGPAFGLSTPLLAVLAERGYDYDASSCPSSLGLLARLYHRRKAAKLGARAEIGEGLYGSLKDCGLPLRPYRWTWDQGAMIEAPVTTLPFLRLPFQGTYLNYLADLSPALAKGYFGTAIGLCRLRRVPPSFLLHATDFLGCDDFPELTYLPGMKRGSDEKSRFMTDLLETYSRRFEVQPIGTFVDGLRSLPPLPQLTPAFGS